MQPLNLKIGHYTNEEQGTGVTVFLPDEPAVGGWWLCGSAPATRDVNLLDPGLTMDRVDALVFTGGSAYGLGASNGVMQWLQEQQRGYQTRFGVVPIVPTAAIFDFGVKGMAFPSAANAYHACQAAIKQNKLRGRVGVGAGATVGKWLNQEQGQSMTGGFGYAELTAQNGVAVLACVVANSIGDVVDEQGKVVAGAIKQGQGFLEASAAIAAGELAQIAVTKQNTTLVAIFTNAQFDKSQLTRIAKMASAGIGRATVPAFTRYDGDVVFALSLGNVNADEVVVGTLAAKATHLALLNAVQDAIPLK